MSHARAVPVPTAAKPTWRGQYRRDHHSPWLVVKNANGDAIAYASPEAAEAGARHVASLLNAGRSAP